MRKLIGLGAVYAGFYGLDEYATVRLLRRNERASIDEKKGFDEKALRETGLTILPGAMSPGEIMRCKRLPSYVASEMFIGDVTRTGPRMSPVEFEKMRTEVLESTKGRYHRTKFDETTTEALEDFEHNWMDMVKRYMGDDALIYRSQLQLLMSEPGSATQLFHQDNKRKGITMIIPLVDVTLDMGPTHLLPGTHLLTQARHDGDATFGNKLAQIIRGLGTLCGQGGIRGELKAGTAIVYDSRTLHRGLKNRSANGRPVLVYRYDLREYPPPQAGILHTTWMRVVGYVLSGVSEIATALKS
mmetsp:Transcript_25143/g.49067  ORF Transcript_25143/g.49067 Transcript_25143/m.49067 type:complete len:300 (-) Transcript_25143:166-1065(-)